MGVGVEGRMERERGREREGGSPVGPEALLVLGPMSLPRGLLQRDCGLLL